MSLAWQVIDRNITDFSEFSADLAFTKCGFHSVHPEEEEFCPALSGVQGNVKKKKKRKKKMSAFISHREAAGVTRVEEET